MRWRMGGGAGLLCGFVLCLLIAPACTTVPETGTPLVPAFAFVPGHELAGTFVVQTELPKNQPTVVALVGLPNLTEVVLRTVRLDCVIGVAQNDPLPRRIVFAWKINDVADNLIEADEVRIKIRPNGECKPKARKLQMQSFAPGTTAEVTITAKGQPLIQGAFVRYQLSVQ